MKYLILVAMAVLSFSIHAIELNNQEIAKVGAHNGQTIFMYLKSSALTTNGCLYSVLYCPSTNQDCKSMLSVALAARAIQSKEVYVAFTKDASNQCIMTHISF